MDENIILMIAIAVSALIGSIITAYVCYVAAYRKQKNRKLEAKLKAELEGSTLPEYELQKVDSWYKGYKFAAILIVILGTIIGFATCYFVSSEYQITHATLCLLSIGTALISGMVVDRYLVHPIADDKFFENVEVPLIENFLAPSVEAVAEETQMTKEDLIKQLLEQAQALMKN